jgi:hypothetical protein
LVPLSPGKMVTGPEKMFDETKLSETTVLYAFNYRNVHYTNKGENMDKKE